MSQPQLHIIMPVKDSLEMTEKAIRAIVSSGHTLCVYDDNSLPKNAKRLDEIATETGIHVVHIAELTNHPSPNYRLVLQLAQQEALASNRHLVIVESDVMNASLSNLSSFTMVAFLLISSTFLTLDWVKIKLSGK